MDAGLFRRLVNGALGLGFLTVLAYAVLPSTQRAPGPVVPTPPRAAPPIPPAVPEPPPEQWAEPSSAPWIPSYPPAPAEPWPEALQPPVLQGQVHSKTASRALLAAFPGKLDDPLPEVSAHPGASVRLLEFRGGRAPYSFARLPLGPVTLVLLRLDQPLAPTRLYTTVTVVGATVFNADLDAP